MCGIVGIVHPEGREKVAPEILRAMNSALTHRGPDDEGYWMSPRVGLGMRRLSIIDLEGGHQPLSNEDEKVWTVFNGEIYNFAELRRQLVHKGHRFKTSSDTEVIVHLYEEEGEDFVQGLRGMFAIALWDEQERKLLLYRDRPGIKPLHYWFKDGTLLFASEIKALLEYPRVSREISLGALNDYLSFLYIPTPRTIYQDIQKLPAGHFLRYQDGEVKICSYWNFTYPASRPLKEEEWAEGLREVLKESVRLHLVSDVPVGAFLSGGVDSSTIVAWMSQVSREPVRTFSIGFEDERFNELPFARTVAERFHTGHHEKVVVPSAVELLPKIISAFDEPFADSSAIPTYLVSEFARREVKVALSGDGGDELFAGYLWTAKEAWLEAYRKMPALLRRGIEGIFLNGNYRPLRETTLRGLIQRFLYDARLSPAHSFGRRVMSFQPWMKQDLLQPSVLEELKGEESLNRIDSLLKEEPSLGGMERFLYLDSKLYLPDDLLTKVDRMSMAHSLEVRVPFLDHKVIEWACSIPFSLKLKGKTTKYILKRAMKNLLPREILKQRKQGFAVPLQRWFRNDLCAFARKALLHGSSRSLRFFRPESIRNLLSEHEKGRQRFGNQLYALVVFELWSRMAEATQGRPAAPSLTLEDLVP